MRKAVFVVCLLCPLSSGCGLVHIGARNLLYEAILYKNSCIELTVLTRLAHQAWHDVERGSGEKHSFDYACGFKAGFVDYIYAGGNGEPPGLPPKRYLRFHEQKSRGSQALLDWYAGFRHGASSAKQSGLRQRLLIPLAPPPPPPRTPPTAPVPTGQENGDAAVDTLRQDLAPDLPLPRPQGKSAPEPENQP